MFWFSRWLIFLQGPVYRIAWSPIAKGVFLSSSADWTVSLWTVDRFQPCITFASRKVILFWRLLRRSTIYFRNPSSISAGHQNQPRCSAVPTKKLWKSGISRRICKTLLLSCDTISFAVVQTRTDQCDLGHTTVYLYIDQLCSEFWGKTIDDPFAHLRDDSHLFQSILAGTNTGSVMVYHLKNLPAPTSVRLFSCRIDSFYVKRLSFRKVTCWASSNSRDIICPHLTTSVRQRRLQWPGKKMLHRWPPNISVELDKRVLVSLFHRRKEKHKHT